MQVPNKRGSFIRLTALFYSLIIFSFSASVSALNESHCDTALAKALIKQALILQEEGSDSVSIIATQSISALKGEEWPYSYQKDMRSLALAYSQPSDLPKAMLYLNYMIDGYSAHKNGILVLDALRFKASQLAFLGKKEESVLVYEAEKKFLDSCLKKEALRYCDSHILHFTSIGISHAIYEQSTLALEQFLVADSLFHLCGRDELKADINYCLGTIFSELDNPAEALKRYKELEAWYDNDEVAYNMTPVYDNIVVIYLMYKQFDSARIYASKALTLARQNGDSVSVAYNYMYLGEINWEELNYLEADANFKIAANYFIKYGLDALHHETQLKRVTAALDSGYILTGSASMLDSMLVYFEAAEMQGKLSEAYKQLARYYYKLHKFKDAFEAYGQYDSINELFQIAKQKEELAEMQAKYETDLHKRKAEEQGALATLATLENENKSSLIWILSSASLLLVIVLVGLMILYRNLKHSRKIVAEQKEGIEKKEKEKSVLLKELHHRVKNNLQIVSSLLNLQKENAKDEAAKGAFKEGQNRVEAMALIHRYLYATDELTKLDLSEYLRQLVQSIAFSYGYHKNEVKLHFDVTETPVDVDLAIPLGLIANELVSNAFKHAFNEEHIPELKVTLSQQEGLILEVSDNGPGISEEDRNKAGDSFGMDLVHTLCSQLKATINYRYENGAVMHLEIAESIYKKDAITYENSVA